MKQHWLLLLVTLALAVGVVGFTPVGVTRAAPTGNGVPILYYDFENNATRSTFENAVEQAVNSGSGAITRAGNTTTISPVGGAGTFNGGAATGQAATGSTWDSATTDPGSGATNYYQFVVNTTGFSQLSISFDNQASATGPARVGVLYSIDGSTFVATTTALTGNAAFASASFDLTSISTIDNQSSVTIRLYAFAGSAGDRTGRSAFGSGGTFRIDNLTVFATTATASKTLLDYPAIGLSIKSGTASTPTYTDFALSGVGTIGTLASNLNLTNTLTVNSGSALVVPSGSSLTAGTLINNGTITQIQLVNGSSPVTFVGTGGYNGVMLNAAGGGDLGNTTVAIKHVPGASCVTGGQNTVARCFQVTPGNGSSGYNATVRLYFDATTDLPGGLVCANLKVYHYDGGGVWSLAGGTGGAATCAGANSYVEVTNVTTFSPFVLADTGNAPNAITLTTFTGQASTNQNWIVLILLAAGMLLLGGWILRRRTMHD